MASSENPFGGHMRQDDPRDLYRSSMGCVWPTVMPARIYLQSYQAYGPLEWLREGQLAYEFTTIYTEKRIVYRVSDPRMNAWTAVFFKVGRPVDNLVRVGFTLSHLVWGNIVEPGQYGTNYYCSTKVWQFAKIYSAPYNPSAYMQYLNVYAVEHDKKVPPPNIWPGK